ncbi:MAG: ABC transporter substrate-binding protein [Gammaproteobacteria bacterium]|nr:ABC transporter substrate-binding protein [Gammaproteobacteria bacterium]
MANGVLTASLWSPQLPYPGAKDYYNRYVELYSEAPYYHGAEGYSAVFVEADVWGRAESLDAKGIRTALNLGACPRIENLLRKSWIWPENITTAALLNPVKMTGQSN